MSFEDTVRQLQLMDKYLEHARTLVDEGRIDEAEQVCLNTLNSLVSLYGPNSLKTCTCLVILADVYYAQRKFAEVITLLEQVLITNENHQNIFSEEDVLSLYFKLTKAVERSGNINEACAAYIELLKRSQESQGTNASFTKKVLESLRSLAKRFPGQFVEAEKILADLAQYDSSNRLVKLRSLSKEDLVKPTLSNPASMVHASKRAIPKVAAAVLAGMLCLWFLMSGIIQDHPAEEKAPSVDATAALNSTMPGQLHMYAGDYSTTDGTKKLSITDAKHGVYTAFNQNNDLSVTSSGADLTAKSRDDKTFVFHTSGQALVDGDGAKLYRSGSPELKTVESMQQVASALNQYYANTGHYPINPREFQAMSEHLKFTNACDSRDTYPLLRTEAVKPIRTIADYESSNQLSVKLLSMDNHKDQPGGIEMNVIPATANGISIVLRGYDREGSLLPTSAHGRCFALNLVGGTVRM